MPGTELIDADGAYRCPDCAVLHKAQAGRLVSLEVDTAICGLCWEIMTSLASSRAFEHRLRTALAALNEGRNEAERQDPTRHEPGSEAAVSAGTSPPRQHRHLTTSKPPQPALAADGRRYPSVVAAAMGQGVDDSTVHSRIKRGVSGRRVA